MNEEVIRFNDHWTSFIASLKGKFLKTVGRNQPLELPMANFILRETVDMWFSEFDSCAMWLRKITKTNPKVGSDIEEIFTGKMKLSEVNTKNADSGYLGYVLPAAGSAVCLTTSLLFRASTLINCAAAVIPFFLLRPVANQVMDLRKNEACNELIVQYIAQLDVYKKQIELILTNSTEHK